MILLSSESLVFQTSDGDLIPCSAELVSIELVGGAHLLDPEIVNNAAASVLHYFKVELCRDVVTLGEFSEALERVLRKFGVMVQPQVTGAAVPSSADPARPSAITSLESLARDAGDSGELGFFPRLRETVKLQLEQSPDRLCFSDLRACVKQLTGARRWSPRCQNLGDQIVEFLRISISSDLQGRSCAVMVR